MIMEQDEITRRNVAIAEYMYPNLVYDDHVGACHEYHCSWEWLMPTVEKIMGEFSENIHSWLPMSSDSPKMFHSKLHGAFWLIEGMDKPLIERVWLVVSEYVLALK